MTAPKVIWAYSASHLSFDEGEWDQSEIPQCGPDWPHARYICADAPELLALVEAVREIVSEAWGYGHLFDTTFHAHVHDVLHCKLEAYEALK